MSTLLNSNVLVQVSVPVLERALHQYTLNPTTEPFDISSVPVVTVPVIEDKVPNVATEGIVTPGTVTFLLRCFHFLSLNIKLSA